MSINVNVFKDTNGNVYSAVLVNAQTHQPVTAEELKNNPNERCELTLSEIDNPSMTLLPMDGDESKEVPMAPNDPDSKIIPKLNSVFSGISWLDLTSVNNEYVFQANGTAADFVKDFNIPV